MPTTPAKATKATKAKKAKKAAKPDKPAPKDKLTPFESLLVDRPLTTPWHGTGEEAKYECDTDLLVDVLSVPLSTAVKQTTGRVAKAIDAWAAQELRRAGFEADEVWPRMVPPRVLTPEMRLLRESGTKAFQKEVRNVIFGPKAALRPVEAKVLGRVFTKQADVLIASWARGPELLISTKTMLSSYGKNLRNRFEEAYGDAKNLRGRFPLLALGFLFVVRADISPQDRRFAQDMLRKLTSEDDGYDCASLIVIHWVGPDVPEKEAEEREHVVDESAAKQAVEAAPTHDPQVKIVHEVMVDDLTPDEFFGGLIRKVLDVTPVDHHVDVRTLYEGEALPIEEGKLSE